MSERIDYQAELADLADIVSDLRSRIKDLEQEVRGLQCDLERRIGNVEDDVRRVDCQRGPQETGTDIGDYQQQL